MQHSGIGSAYDILAPKWLDGQFNGSNGIDQHKRALRFLPGGPGGGWALNVGCGCNTRFNHLLRERELKIEAVDISERMVALAREADPTVQLHHADICSWQAGRTYRFITAWDSIRHVQLHQQRALMFKLMSLLEPGGVLTFSAGGRDDSHEHTDSTMGPSVYYSTLGIPDLVEVIQVGGCALRHLEFDQWPHQHLVVIAQRAA